VLLTVAHRGCLSINRLASIGSSGRGLSFPDTLAGFTSSISALSVLAQGFVLVELGNAFAILFWVAIFGIRFDLIEYE
jgi:hypothetical protein